VAAPSSEIEELRALAERAHGDEPGAPAGSEAAVVDLVRPAGESVRALASELAASNFGRGLLEAMSDQLRSWPRTPDGRLSTGDYGARF
jgi:hypothetical protein